MFWMFLVLWNQEAICIALNETADKILEHKPEDKVLLKELAGSAWVKRFRSHRSAITAMWRDRSVQCDGVLLYAVLVFENKRN